MPEHLIILYRSPIEFCNYACPYCPWHANPRTIRPERLQQDREELERITQRLLELAWDCEVFLVPKGENLILDYYWEALSRLLQGETIRRVTVQTNLSFDPLARLGAMSEASLRKLALWISYHPMQAAEGIPSFLDKLNCLQQCGVTFSVGLVGLREHFATLRQLAPALAEREITLWVNAYKREPGYYSPQEQTFLESIDPTFTWTHIRLPTLGVPCHAGHLSVFLDSQGDLRRCLFAPETLGNIFSDFALLEKAHPCPQTSCHCYLGHLNIPSLGYESRYGENLCVRIPQGQPRKTRSPDCGSGLNGLPDRFYEPAPKPERLRGRLDSEREKGT